LFKGNLQQKGMTLMEILVVIGISGILFIIILSAVDYGVKGQKSVDSMQNISSYTLEIRQLLWRQEVCSPNIKSFFASSVTEGSNVGVSKILPVEKDAMGVYQVKAAAAPLIEAGENTPSAVKYGIKLKNMEINVAKKITDKF